MIVISKKRDNHWLSYLIFRLCSCCSVVPERLPFLYKKKPLKSNSEKRVLFVQSGFVDEARELLSLLLACSFNL